MLENIILDGTVPKYFNRVMLPRLFCTILNRFIHEKWVYGGPWIRFNSYFTVLHLWQLYLDSLPQRYLLPVVTRYSSKHLPGWHKQNNTLYELFLLSQHIGSRHCTCSHECHPQTWDTGTAIVLWTKWCLLL